MSKIKKVFISILIIVLSLSVLVACGDNQEENTQKEIKQEEIKQEEIKSDNPYFKNLIFYSEFPNDVTGNWRMAKFDTEDPAQEYIVDYYNDYFKSDKEIHFIYNFALNEVNVVRMYDSNYIDLSIRKYIPDEERDAKEAGGGELIKECYINTETKEVSDVPYPELYSE